MSVPWTCVNIPLTCNGCTCNVHPLYTPFNCNIRTQYIPLTLSFCHLYISLISVLVRTDGQTHRQSDIWTSRAASSQLKETQANKNTGSQGTVIHLTLTSPIHQYWPRNVSVNPVIQQTARPIFQPSWAAATASTGSPSSATRSSHTVRFISSKLKSLLN